jgi:hypothetical protein
MRAQPKPHTVRASRRARTTHERTPPCRTGSRPGRTRVVGKTHRQHLPPKGRKAGPSEPSHARACTVRRARAVNLSRGSQSLGLYSLPQRAMPAGGWMPFYRSIRDRTRTVRTALGHARRFQKLAPAHSSTCVSPKQANKQPSTSIYNLAYG